MRDELAGKLLDTLMDWSDADRASAMEDLRQLAAFKYDSYEGFAAGERFFESLARWLPQFADREHRTRLLQFIRDELIFISRDEMNHAIACAYPDFVKPVLISRVADKTQVPRHRVRAINNSDEFRSLRRRTIYLGLSDGARVDRFRRSNPELSHEQFWLTPELGPRARKIMLDKLGEAMDKQNLVGERQFEEVVLLDDFYGSGRSLLRKDNEGWSGKLPRVRDSLTELTNEGILIANAHVMIVLYVASEAAHRYISDTLGEFEPNWKITVVQTIPDYLCLRDGDIAEMSKGFFDEILIDEHKGNVPLGFGDIALPLVLHHNTPNNSVSILWADSVGREGGNNRRALFPRYERHHVDRP